MAGEATNPEGARLAGAPREREHRPGLRAAGVAAARIAGPIVARRGGGVLARLKAEWSLVVSPEVAAAAWPAALARDGALKLHVAPGYALELQHRAPLTIERINIFFGRQAVTRLVLVQGPLPLAVPPGRTPAAPLREDETSTLDGRLAGIIDPGLRDALAGLGRLVLTGRGRG